MATASLDATMGIWLVSLFIATMLYGMGVIQAYLYFHWYPNDKWGLKLTVICLMVFETLQITLFLVGVYQPLIQHFGDLSATFRITWYFAYCIYTCEGIELVPEFSLTRFVPVSPKYKIIPVFIVRDRFCAEILILIGHGLKVVLALLQIGSGLGNLSSDSMITCISNASSSDNYFLKANSRRVSSTELGNFTLLDKTKVERVPSHRLCPDLSMVSDDDDPSGGYLNSALTLLRQNEFAAQHIDAAVNIVLFLSVPHTFWFFLGLIPSSKFYMNSMLATLNTRDHIRGRHEDAIAIGSLTQSSGQRPPPAPAMPTGSHFEVNASFSRDHQDDGKKAFDMI
ncbi:hypothetical protein DFH07DRAFT_769848 [Mycena maculata]|uniref:Uncharacterized protein n=1 Tax=Mycena maculata TaxID=230809 RepID=A0AAD7JMC7_9AGAR|nr:hypothetical protein DFH07DRAFT_769848 [Mycena maculata]